MKNLKILSHFGLKSIFHEICGCKVVSFFLTQTLSNKRADLLREQDGIFLKKC